MTHKIVITGFQFIKKFARAYIFQEIFLLTNTSIDFILEMTFLNFSNTNIVFAD